MLNVQGARMKNWDLEKVKKTLSTHNQPSSMSSGRSNEQDTKEKKALFSACRGIKYTGPSTYFAIDKAILNTLIISYDVHILKDKTASRESLKKFIINDGEILEINNEEEPEETHQEEGNRPSVIGKRFKYLMEKQLYSRRMVIISTFLNSSRWNYSSDCLILARSFLSSFFGKEKGKISKDEQENYQIGKEVFSLFLRVHDQLDYADKYWSFIFSLLMRHSNCGIVEIDEYEQIFKKILEIKTTFKIDISIIEFIFFETDFTRNGSLPLITQIFEKNTFEGYLQDYNMHKHVYDTTDELKFAQQVAEYLKYLEKFRTREDILGYYLYSFIITSIGLLSEIYVDEFLKSYPIDLRSVSFYECERCNVTAKVLKICNDRGIEVPLESVEKAFNKGYYTTNSFNTVRYMIDHYNLDLFEIERRTEFLSQCLTTLSQYDFFYFDSFYEVVFLKSPIEWEKIGSINGTTNQIKEGLIDLISIMCETASGEQLRSIVGCFTPNIFNMELMTRALLAANIECIKALYYITMYSENEKLSDHMDQMLKDEHWSHFTEVDLSSYDPSDPRYLVTLYRLVKELEAEAEEAKLEILEN